MLNANLNLKDMRKNYVLQTLMFVLFLTSLTAFSKEGIQPTSEKIAVKSNSISSVSDPGWSYTCDDGIEVELLSLGLKSGVPASLTIANNINVERIVVEIVYKGNNPGSTIEIQDAAGNSYTADRAVPTGGSPNVWYYRAELPTTTTVNYSNTTNANYAQSMLAYVFRKMNNGVASSGVFTALSGYNDIQSTTIPIQTDSGPRTVTVELPISELTPDGRYIHVEVSAADGSFAELTEIINSFPSGQCCIKVFELELTNVAGSVNEIEIRIDTRNRKNGQTVNGQSWVMGGAVKTNVRCSCVEFDTELPTADNLVDHIIIEDISELPDVTFSDNCSNITIEYNQYYSRESCEIDFANVADSNILLNDKKYHWNKGYYSQEIYGSTKIYGRIVDNTEPNSGWNAEIFFDELVNYSTWTGSGGQTGSDTDNVLRKYAAIDFNKDYSLNGFGNNANSSLELISTANLNYMEKGLKNGMYSIGFWSSYQGDESGDIIMEASLTKCVKARDGADLLVREWTVTDSAGNVSLFIQRVEIEY